MIEGLRLDERDLKIIAILRRDGRIAKTELARRVNLSPTPCWERIRRLEAAGVILGYGARINPALEGPRLITFVQAELEAHRARDFRRFEEAMERAPEVRECWAVGGGVDYILKVATTDIEAYQAFMDKVLAADLGLKRYFSFLVTKPVKTEETLSSPPPE